MHQPPLRATRSLFPLLICLAGATVASAADAPVIERVLDDYGKETRLVSPARTFEVQGRNLYTPPADPKSKGFPDLSATLGGKSLVVLAATPTSLRFAVSRDQPLGKEKSLVIRVGGVSVKARVDVGPAEPQIPDDLTGTGGDPPESLFQITKFTHASKGAGAIFKGEGQAKGLIDGMKVSLTLSYGAHEIRTRVLKVKGERFSVNFGPFRERLPVGFYSLELAFSLNAQRKAQTRKFGEALKAAGKKGDVLASYRSARRRSFVGVGGTGPKGQILPEDRKAQEAQLRERIVASVEATETLLKELEAALALAQRIYFRAPGASNLDEARYLQWLVDKGHAKDTAAAKGLLADTRFASSRGEFDEQAWTAWIKERVFEGVRDELIAGKAFKGETLCPIDPKADALALRAQGELLELAQGKLLFKRAKLRVPSELRNPGLKPVRPVSGASAKSLRAILTLLRKRVGA